MSTMTFNSPLERLHFLAKREAAEQREQQQACEQDAAGHQGQELNPEQMGEAEALGVAEADHADYADCMADAAPGLGMMGDEAVADAALDIDGDCADVDPDLQSSSSFDQDCWYPADTPLDLGNDSDEWIPSAALMAPAAADPSLGLDEQAQQISYVDPQDL